MTWGRGWFSFFAHKGLHVGGLSILWKQIVEHSGCTGRVECVCHGCCVFASLVTKGHAGRGSFCLLVFPCCSCFFDFTSAAALGSVVCLDIA